MRKGRWSRKGLAREVSGLVSDWMTSVWIDVRNGEWQVSGHAEGDRRGDEWWGVMCKDPRGGVRYPVGGTALP